MDNKISYLPEEANKPTPAVSKRHKELADLLRGKLSYKEHYAYLLDWYMYDRNTKNVNANVNDVKVPNIVVADEHVKTAFNDVLESIKHLDRKIDRVSTIQDASGIKVGKTRRQGNIFTRLVDRRA